MLKEQELAQRKIRKLHFLAISRLKEIRVLANGLFSKLDDWIINGIKLENQEIYNYLSFLRNSIQNSQKSTLKLQEHPPVSQIYKPLQYMSLNPYLFPIYEEKEHNSFLLTEAKVLLEDIKSLAFDESIIEKKVIEEYLIRRRLNSDTKLLFPQIILEADIKKVLEKMIITGTNFIRWKVFMNSMVLLRSKVINSQIKMEIKEKISEDYFNLENFFEVSFI